MKTFILLLRGINVGGRHILPMKALAALLERQGLQDIKTYIQSGNVVARGKQVAPAKIAAAIEQEFGFTPMILVLEAGSLARAIANNPFPEAEGKTVQFYFCADKPAPDKTGLDALKSSSERWAIKDKVFYLHAPDGIGRSKLAAKAESLLGTTTTTRNLNTVLKLQAMVND